VLPWRCANRRFHHLRIGHDTGHLLDVHVHGSLLRGSHSLARASLARTYGARTSVTLTMVNVMIALATISVISFTMPSITRHGMTVLVTSTINVVRAAMTNLAACVTGAGESIARNHGAHRALWPIGVDAL
jgi:hypothetical protein